MKHEKTLRLVILAVLLAIVGLFTFTSIGYIRINAIGFAITLMCLPVVIASVLYGYKGGLVLGAAFALSSLYTAFTQPTIMVSIMVRKLSVLLPVIIIPRLLIPIFTTLVYRITKKMKPAVRFALAAGTGSLTNTVFFLGLAYLLGGPMLAEGMGESLTAIGVILLTTAATNGLPEMAVIMIISTAVLLALKAAMPKLFKH